MFSGKKCFLWQSAGRRRIYRGCRVIIGKEYVPPSEILNCWICQNWYMYFSKMFSSAVCRQAQTIYRAAGWLLERNMRRLRKLCQFQFRQTLRENINFIPKFEFALAFPEALNFTKLALCCMVDDWRIPPIIKINHDSGWCGLIIVNNQPGRPPQK